MAISDYAIPWSPPDLTSGIALLRGSLQQRKANKRADLNAETQRLYADANLRRIDAQMAREEADRNSRINEQMRQMAEKRAAFMERIPYLQRNPLLPAIAKEYGIEGSFVDDTRPQAPAVNPLLAATQHAQAAPGPTVDAVPSEMAAPGAALDPGQEHTTVAPMADAGVTEGAGLDSLTDEQRRIMAENVTSVGDRTTLARPPGEIPPERIVKLTEADIPPITADMPHSNPSPAAAPMPSQPMVVGTTPGPRNKLFRATIGGQTFDVASQSDSTGLGEKYDAIYRRLLQEPGGEKTALAKVTELWKAEQGQEAAAQRTAALVSGRQAEAGQREQFQRWLWDNYHLTADQLLEQKRLDRESRERAAAKASGQAPVPAAMAEVIQAREEGAPLSEVTRTAAEKKLPAKTFQAAVGAVPREAALAERTQEKRAGLEVNDASGKFLGYAHNATQANQMKKQTDQFAQAKVRLEELVADIEKDGARVLSPNEIQDRLSKAESVNAAMRVYNGLGATDASQRLEARITGAIGTPGHGWLMGANVDVIKRILHEAEMQHNARVNTTLRSQGGPSRQLAPVLGGQRPDAGAPPRKTTTLVGPNGEKQVFDSETGARIQ